MSLSTDIEAGHEMIREYISLIQADRLTTAESVREAYLRRVLLDSRGFLCRFRDCLVDIDTNHGTIFVTPLSTIPDLTRADWVCPREWPVPKDILEALGKPKNRMDGPGYEAVWKNIQQSHNKLYALRFRTVLNTEKEFCMERDDFQVSFVGNTLTLSKQGA